jgi:hypothetical protein
MVVSVDSNLSFRRISLGRSRIEISENELGRRMQSGGPVQRIPRPSTFILLHQLISNYFFSISSWPAIPPLHHTTTAHPHPNIDRTIGMAIPPPACHHLHTHTHMVTPIAIRTKLMPCWDYSRSPRRCKQHLYHFHRYIRWTNPQVFRGREYCWLL